MPGLERRLKAELSGEVQFDRFTRGRYATDASHYQIMPVGVVAPRTIEEAERAIGIARAEGVSVLARGGGTSQAGQTVGEVAGGGLLQIPHPHPRSRPQARALHGRARHRARRSQPRSSSRTGCGSRSISRPPRAPPSAAWPATIPAAGARCATAPCATMCSRSRRSWRTARWRISAASAAASMTCRRRCGRSPRICWRSARAKPARSPRASPRCSAASAATISTRWCPARTTSISRTCWSAPKARSAFPRASN